MSDSAGYFAATVFRPDGPRDRLATDLETRDRSANTARTSNDSLVIDDFEATNSLPNRLG
jgi:hypothetical protein